MKGVLVVTRNVGHTLYEGITGHWMWHVMQNKPFLKKKTESKRNPYHVKNLSSILLN